MRIFLMILAAAIAASVAGCASVQIDPQPPVATTLAPFNARLGLNHISVPSGSLLRAASLDGKPALCTERPAYFALGESRSICFMDEAGSGRFSQYYVLGTLRSLTYPADVPYALGPGATAALQSVASPTPEQIDSRRRTDAECRYEAAQGSANTPGLLMPAAVFGNLYRLCMQARAY
jgi:hypothetical protein